MTTWKDGLKPGDQARVERERAKIFSWANKFVRKYPEVDPDSVRRTYAAMLIGGHLQDVVFEDLELLFATCPDRRRDNTPGWD